MQIHTGSNVVANVRSNVVANVRVAGTHSWPDALSEDISFLRHEHRHEFHITVKARVGHGNRDIEFFQFKADIMQKIRERFPTRIASGPDVFAFGHLSCEMIAETLQDLLRSQYPTICFISVYEDGENGAELIIEREGTQ